MVTKGQMLVGGGISQELKDEYIHVTIYKIENQQRHVLDSTESLLVFCDNLCQRKRNLKENNIHVCIYIYIH